MKCVRCRLRSTVLLGIGLLAAPLLASAQTQENLNGGPADQQIYRRTDLTPGDTSPPYDTVFQNVGVGATVEPKVGGVRFEGDSPFIGGPRIGLPVTKGFRPEDAQIKIGQFYLLVGPLTTGLLYSDNVNEVTAPRKDGVIGIVALDVTAVLQATEGLRFAISGEFVYLPFKNKFGVQGFGINAPYFLLGESPQARMQASYDFLLAGWETRFYDEFRVDHPWLGYDPNASVLYEGRDFRDEDRAGRYFFTAPGGLLTDRPDNTRGRFDANTLFYRNTVGAAFSRLLPTVTRATLGYEHINYWYADSPINNLDEHDRFYGILDSERENTRFKPFISYSADSYDGRRTWGHLIVGGVHGPITENLDFLGDFGYQKNPGNVQDTYVWKVQFDHTPGPLTRQSLLFQRRVTQPDVDAEDTVEYILQRILGPDLQMRLNAEYSRFHDLDHNGSDSDIWREDLLFDMILGPRLTTTFGVSYYAQDFNSPLFGDDRQLLGLVDLNYQYSERTRATLGYRHDIHTRAGVNQSYVENLVYLRIIHDFR